MILSYREQREVMASPKYRNEPVVLIPKEEWLKLVNYKEDEIVGLTHEEIRRRIDALKSIEEAPHYTFTPEHFKDPKNAKMIEQMYDETLNGGAGNRIFLLEKLLKMD